jgi:hypothetical protein
MTIKALKVEVRRSEVTNIPTVVAVWELPILEAMHQAVKVIEEVVLDREAPSAQDEFSRLTTRYGRTTNEDGSRGISFVGAVYGQFGVGLQRLGDAIKSATIATPATDESAADLLAEQLVQ